MGDIQRAVAGRGERLIEIERSRFIGIALPARSPQQAEDALVAVRAEHPDATHHCCAWRAGPGHERLSDDGEPQGTAGLPLLESLRRQGIDFGLLVVVRYYGGRKLGRPGLYRAYLEVGRDALAAAPLAELVPGREYLLHLQHREHQALLRALLTLSGEVLETSWGSDVAVRFWLPEEAGIGRLQSYYDGAGLAQEIGRIVRERPID